MALEKQRRTSHSHKLARRCGRCKEQQGGSICFLGSFSDRLTDDLCEVHLLQSGRIFRQSSVANLPDQ
jgi:hypothetical protein